MSKGRALVEAEALLAKATKKELERDWQTAYQLYTQAAQALVEIYGKSKDSVEKADSKRAAGIALERAQKLKRAHPDIKGVSRDLFSAGEQNAVLVASSTVNGIKYPQWADPSTEEFAQQTVYRDQTPTLINSAPNWQESRNIMGSIPLIDHGMMPSELAQSIVPNCSVVTSVIVCWNHHIRHKSKLMLSQLFPQPSYGTPAVSPNDKYFYKMFINGCYRRCIFDSLLPMQDGQLMCMTATKSSCMWPILVEKAYMKYNGGYDFAGSDPGADLRALIGWIPEHQSFKSSSFEQEKMWTFLVNSFNKGDVLVTIATSNDPPDHINGPNLLPRHAYACIDMEDSEERLLTIVNPWRHAGAGPDDLSNTMAGVSLGQGPVTNEECWKLSWEDACTIFDTLCLSWNPERFTHTITHHRIWKSGSKPHDTYSTDLNHQIRVFLQKGATDTEIWALLTRHVGDRQDPPAYIALHAFEEDGYGASFVKPESLTIRGQYNEGTHCLLKITPGQATSRISFITSLYFGDSTAVRDVAYTLTLHSNQNVSFDTSPLPVMTTKQANVDFQCSNSGGNVRHTTYFCNPQWKLHIPSDKSAGNVSRDTKSKKARVVLRAFAGKDIPLNIKIYRTNERRMNDSIDGHIAFDSGIYNFGLAFGQVDLPSGEYIIVLSTFSPGQYGAATLEVSSSEQINLEKLHAEGAGMHLKTIKGVWDGPTAAGGPGFKRYWENPAFEIKAERPTDIMVRLQANPGTIFLPINVSLFQNSAPSGDSSATEIATSGQYRESVFGVRITQRRISAGTYLLIPSTYSSGLKGSFEISVWSDAPLTRH